MEQKLFKKFLPKSWRLMLVVACSTFFASITRAQNTESRYFYAIELLETGEIVRRGETTQAGIPASGQLILAPNTDYRYWLYEIDTGFNGSARFTSASPGGWTTIPSVPFGLPLRPDSDGDGLDDEAEFIIGTNALSDDSDGDGILDGAEIAQGLNPLDGLATITGIISAVDTPGTAVDVAAFNDVVVIADDSNGISVFNVFNGMDPLIVSQVDTPGSAQAIALSVRDSESLVAVADGDAGLAIIDITDPPSASIVAQLNLGSEARAVAVAGGFAYVGLSSGQIVIVDLIIREEFARFDGTNLGRMIDDLGVKGEYMYVMTDGKLDTLRIEGADLIQESFLSVTGGRGAGGRRHRLFVGTDLLYARYFQGYNIVSLSDPANPVLVRTESTAAAGWKQIVSNGSGLGIAAVSPNSTDDGPHHIDLYSLGADGTESTYLTTFQTPGLAAAVTLYNGIAYVADSSAGLQVINYLAFDNLGVPPVISIELPSGDNLAEEGKLFRINANVEDDVQVRNVEFYVDGVQVATDGNFPFEHYITTPLIENQLTFRVQARASDTGGNATFSDEVTITLTPDATAPQIVSRLPLTIAGSGLNEVAAFFNEPMDVATFSSGNFFVEEAGPDGLSGTSDDVIVSGLSFEWREEVDGGFLIKTESFAPGKYQVTVKDVTDLVGNTLAEQENWTFTVYDIDADGDADGLPDLVEVLLGLNPNDYDSDDNGVSDGLEDFDGDGLKNVEEILLSSALGVDHPNAPDPTLSDSNGNGILDSDEDSDGDTLRDIDELLTYGTDLLDRDSDGDGFNDSDEIGDGSDPLDEESLPPSITAINFGYARGPSFSVFNKTDPSADIDIGYARGPSFSVFNSTDPSADINIGYARGASFSVFNSTDPSADIDIGYARGPSFSVFNTTDPSADIDIGYARGPSFSVFNGTDPSADIDIGYVRGLSFSVSNSTDPSADIDIRHAKGPSFSVLNEGNE